MQVVSRLKILLNGIERDDAACVFVCRLLLIFLQLDGSEVGPRTGVRWCADQVW